MYEVFHNTHIITVGESQTAYSSRFASILEFNTDEILDFALDFWISRWTSGISSWSTVFNSWISVSFTDSRLLVGFLDVALDFNVFLVWISTDGERDFRLSDNLGGNH